MIDLEHKAAMDRYLFAPKGKRAERLAELQAVTKRLLAGKSLRRTPRKRRAG